MNKYGVFTSLWKVSDKQELEVITDGFDDDGNIAENKVVTTSISEHAIITDHLDVTALNGTTIIGSTVKTAETGQRVEIDSTDGMQVYDSGGTVIAQFNGGVYANSIGHCTAHKNSVLGPELEFDYTLISGLGYFRFYIDGNQIMTLDQYGGLLLIPATSCIYIDGTKIIDSQQAAVADASGGATVDAEARTAINALLARLRTHGLIAT